MAAAAKVLVRVMADYGCHPLWAVYPDGELDNISPESLPISRDLADSLNSWAGEFDAILNEDDPASSDFATLEDERSFNDRGRRLAEWLAREIGRQYRVTYHDSLEARDVSVGP